MLDDFKEAVLHTIGIVQYELTVIMIAYMRGVKTVVSQNPNVMEGRWA